MPIILPPEVHRVPLVEALGDYQKKGVGVDMALKAVLNILRLQAHYSADPEDKKKFFNAADAVVECRMLCNFGRPLLTLRQGIRSFRSRSCYDFWPWLFLTLSYFLRVPEQLSGDLNYLQKTICHQWSREKLSFCYRFFKSWSLTCCLLTELLEQPHIRSKLARATSDMQARRVKRALRVSNALVVRTLCDMYVYFKWIPSYTPNKTLEFICGFVSGVIGIWLVWKDTRYVIDYTSVEVDRCSPGSPCIAGPSISSVEGGDGISGDEG